MEAQAHLRKALSSKRPAIGFWLTFPKACVVKTILAGGGFDWTLIDAEHGQITDADYFELTTAIGGSGVSPIIRIPDAQEHLVKRALDAGAHGVMTPMCHTAADAKKIVSWSKYPPTGTRGFGPMFSAHSFNGLTEAGYPAGADKNLLVIVQIESRQGVENVEEIAKVDGLDVLFIGPFDLGKSMQVTHGGEEHEAAIARILKAAKDAGKVAAVFCTSGAQARQRIQQGFDMVSICTDVGSLSAEFDRQLAATHGVEMGKGRSVY